MNRTLLTWFLVLVLAPLTARSQVARTPTRETPHQFLFVVEQSSAMNRKETVTLNTVYQLIATGAYGAMRRGDIYRIWTFDREVRDKAFAPQVWLPEVAEALAATATKFIHEEKHSRSAKLDPAVARFVEVAKGGVPLTVFLITSGNDVLFGTPFDLEVSTLLFQHMDKMTKEKRPYVITLVARDGKIGGWAVDAGGGRITVPVIPEQPVAKPVEPEPVSTKPVVEFTVEPPPAMSAKPKAPKPPPVPEPPKTVTVEAPKVVVSPPSTPAPAAVRPSAPPPAVPTAIPPPNVPSPAPKPPKVVVSSPEPKATQPSPAKPFVEVSLPVAKVPSPPAPLPPEPKPVAMTEPAPVKPPPTKPQPMVEKSSPAVGKPPTVVEPPKAADVAPVVKPPASAAKAVAPAASEAVEPSPKPSPAPPPAQTAVVVPGDPATGGWRFLVLGGALLVVAAIMVAVLMRRGRAVPQASLISQSLDRERKQ